MYNTKIQWKGKEKNKINIKQIISLDTLPYRESIYKGENILLNILKESACHLQYWRT
jgi:hypothetical protein